MSAVEVETVNKPPEDDPKGARASGREQRTRSTDRASSSSPEVEREVTKRELIRSVSNILIVILYMVFTLLRDRDAGVVVVDAEADDWDE